MQQNWTTRMTTPLHVAIVGGGASGMMAAITAARSGARVTLFERHDRVGKKLLATGNGRCNLTNSNCAPGNFHGDDPSFVRPALEQFGVQQAISFFNSLGVCTKVEDEGKVFPRTGQASTVLDVLRHELDRAGAVVRTRSPVGRISRRNGAFVLHIADAQEQADRVIVTAGSKAAPQLGGSDAGIELLKHLGHAATGVFPALVPLKTGARFARQLKGVKVIAAVQLDVAGEPPLFQQGEILFTDYGLSGPPIIQLSLTANSGRHKGREVSVVLDLFPDWTEEQIAQNLDERFSARPDAHLDIALIGLVHKRLVPVVLAEAGIADGATPVGKISRNESVRIVKVLKSWRFAVTGSLSWNEAQLMAGGIRTADFHAETLESRIVKGLFAAGEVLDVAGDCGGYNLQWAWSSGYVAGMNAAKKL
jgi:predicted Rossmann fold flavoprotein